MVALLTVIESSFFPVCLMHFPAHLKTPHCWIYLISISSSMVLKYHLGSAIFNDSALLSMICRQKEANRSALHFIPFQCNLIPWFVRKDNLFLPQTKIAKCNQKEVMGTNRKLQNSSRKTQCEEREPKTLQSAPAMYMNGP